MKNLIYALISLITIALNQSQAQSLELRSCTVDASINPNHPKAKAIQGTMRSLVKQNIPGAVIAIYDKHGWWANAEGFAKIEDQTPMQSCYLHYLQSIAKTYTAVCILKLYEAGKIDLNASIDHYLPRKIASFVTNASKITVSMLLNHTSGITEYNYAPSYVTKLLQNPNYVFSAEEYVKIIKGKKQDFAPGSRHSYRNINYVLLALMVEHLTGDHRHYMEEVIFKPLGLTNTFYNIKQGETYGNRLVNSYWDRHSNSILENISILQNTNVASMIGDDGLITTPIEAVVFLRGLLEGKLLRSETLKEMKTWVTNKKGVPVYGLGLSRTKLGGATAIGHSGGGLGSGCQLYYFPKQEVYMFVGINLGTVTDSPIHQKALKVVKQIYEGVLK